MTGSDHAPITDAKELLNVAELDAIRFYEVSAQRREETRDPEVGIDIRLRHAEQEIEVRCAARVTGDEADFRADASALFSLDHPVQVTEAAMAEFVARVGVMTVYPYLREAVHQSASKLGVAQPVMKLLRPGDVKVTVSGDDDSAGEH